MRHKRVYVGTCGFPRKREEVFKSLDAVEVQETFYDLVSRERASRLGSEKPEGFRIAVKVFQAITHPSTSPTWKRMRTRLPGDPGRYGLLRPTRENLEIWERVLETMRLMRAEIAVFQTPPSFGFSEEALADVREFFSSIERGGLVVVWEPRGTWNEERYRERLCSLLSELGVVHAVDIFRNRPCPGDTAYIRLHGIGGGEVNYRYKYTDEDLGVLRREVEGLGAGEVYVMFNNVYMFDDATRFRRMLRGEV